MTTATLGSWRNPPLAYVVAELVISPYYSLQTAIPKLQDALRATYPRTIEGQELVIDGNTPPTPHPIWRLISADQRQGVQLGTRAISLHVTSYLDSTDFFSRWAEVLDAVEGAKLGAFVERAGLRYVDLIVPSDGHVPSDYLASGLQGIAPDGAIAQGAFWSANFAIDGSAINARTAAPAPGNVLLPPNFNALPLQKPNVMLDAEKRVGEHNAIGFIDTDCLEDVQQPFDAHELIDVYTAMQKLTSKTFKALISELARQEWL